MDQTSAGEVHDLGTAYEAYRRLRGSTAEGAAFLRSRAKSAGPGVPDGFVLIDHGTKRVWFNATTAKPWSWHDPTNGCRHC